MFFFEFFGSPYFTNLLLGFIFLILVCSYGADYDD